MNSFNYNTFPFQSQNGHINKTSTPPNNQLYDQSVVRDMNICDNKTDWKKVVSDRLVRRMMKYREERIDRVRLNKNEIINEVMNDEMLEEGFDEEGMLLSVYFDRVLSLFEESEEEYQMEVSQDSNVSVCPMCYYPVIKTSKKILCLNLCYEYEIPPFMFHSGFTLDNFIDILGRTYQDHRQCLIKSGERLEIIMFEDDAHIICGKCFKDKLYY